MAAELLLDRQALHCAELVFPSSAFAMAAASNGPAAAGAQHEQHQLRYMAAVPEDLRCFAQQHLRIDGEQLDALLKGSGFS